MSGIVEFLSRATHPEIHHFRAGRHPGPGWWLKTVCPNPDLPEIDRDGFGAAWLEFATRYRNITRLEEIAFDWEGNRIADTWSIWLVDDVDVEMTLGPDGLDLRVLDKAATDRSAAQDLRALLAGAGQDAPQIAAAANALQNHADRVLVPDERRREFHVVRGDT